MFSMLSRPLIASALGLVLLVSFANPGSAESRSDLERNKDGVNQRIDGAKKDFNESSKKLSDSVSALEAAQASLATARKSLSETSGQLAVARAKDSQIRKRLAASEAALDRSMVELKRGAKSAARAEERVREYTLLSLQDGDSGLRAFNDLLRGASPSSFTEQMSLNDSISDAQLAVMQRLDASKVVLKLKRDNVRSLRDEVAAARRQSAANLLFQKSLETRAKKQTAQVGTLVSNRAGAKKAATKTLAEDAEQLREFEVERASLSERLRALAAAELAKQKAAELAKKKAELAKKKKAAQRPKPSHKTPDKAPARSSGSSTLFRPVNGRVTSRYGMRVHPVTGVYKLHDGTDFGAGCGTPIRAAASGTVIERYYNGAYGNRLIVNHGIKRGVNVVTTYNHAASYIVRAGQRVSRGQTIGYVGSTGYSTGCHLHFMVITNGSTVNPMSWVG